MEVFDANKRILMAVFLDFYTPKKKKSIFFFMYAVYGSELYCDTNM